MCRVVIIDDDNELCEMLAEFLQPEGFVVDAFYEGESGLQHALSGEHSLIILDVMLPGMTGFEVLQNLRKTSSIPVLMLTARGEDIDRILGLEMGADDYLAKPFNPRELLARIRAILRRTVLYENFQDGRQEILELDDMVVDPGARTVKQNGKTIKITEIEFSLLYELLQKAGQVITREELTEKVLKRALEQFDRSIDVHISNLRKKLGNMVNGRERIKTIRRIGYLYTKQEQ